MLTKAEDSKHLLFEIGDFGTYLSQRDGGLPANGENDCPFNMGRVEHIVCPLDFLDIFFLEANNLTGGVLGAIAPQPICGADQTLGNDQLGNSRRSKHLSLLG